MKEGRKPECPEQTTDNELWKMPHTKALNSSPNRDSNPHSSLGGRLGKQMCKPLHHTSPQHHHPYHQLFTFKSLLLSLLYSMILFSGQLLLSSEDTVAVIFLCADCCLCPALHQSIWQWPPGHVLHWLQRAVVTAGAHSLHSVGGPWGESVALEVVWNVLSFFLLVPQELWLSFSCIFQCVSEHVYVPSRMHLLVSQQTCMCVYVCVCAHTHTCACVSMCVSVCVCLCLCMCVPLSVCPYICLSVLKSYEMRFHHLIQSQWQQ